MFFALQMKVFFAIWSLQSRWLFRQKIGIKLFQMKKKNEIIAVLCRTAIISYIFVKINWNLEALITNTTDYMFLSKKDELRRCSIGDIASIKAGGDCPKEYSPSPTTECAVPIFSNGTENEGIYGFTSQPIIEGRSVTVAARGTIGYCVRREGKYVPIIRLLSVCPYDVGADTYLHQIISRMTFKKNGSVQQQLTVPELSITQIPYPSQQELKKYEEITRPLILKINHNKKENQQLTKQRDELLPLLMNGQVSINSDLAK